MKNSKNKELLFLGLKNKLEDYIGDFKSDEPNNNVMPLDELKDKLNKQLNSINDEHIISSWPWRNG